MRVLRRNRKLTLTSHVLFATTLLAQLSQAASIPTCSVTALSGLGIAHVTIASATLIAPAKGDPEYCDVKGALTTTGAGAADGLAKFEIKLPREWNGKFLFFGNGGMAGVVRGNGRPEDVAESLSRGYGTVATDMGHTSMNAFGDQWALKSKNIPNTPAIIDFYYRSTHDMTVSGKQLMSAYYQRPVQHSYFAGCSTGGRQGMMEAMRYPDDYDGIIAGAPLLSHWISAADVKVAKAFLNAFVPPEKLKTVGEAVTAGCDAVDGLKDGLIQNSAACSFNPHSLVCKDDNLSKCLTTAQADAFDVVFSSLKTSSGGFLYPGQAVAGLNTTPFNMWALSDRPARDPNGPEPWGENAPTDWLAGEGAVKQFVAYDWNYNVNKDWPLHENILDESAVKQYSDRLGGEEAASARDPKRLARYLQKNKKLIMYHGFADPSISPFQSEMFYLELAKQLGGLEKTQQNVRLFMVPEMAHCGGGTGPNRFELLSKLEDWVERGAAPNTIMASHTKNNDDAQSIDRTMPLCMFPETAHYSGNGDLKDGRNWSCTNNQDLLKVGDNGRQAGLK